MVFTYFPAGPLGLNGGRGRGGSREGRGVGREGRRNEQKKRRRRTVEGKR